MADDLIKPSQEKETVWKRLTRLFRSGPVVRHKIAAGEPMTEPRGTARAYKKELSSLYVHSLASYGQYERLSRYSDYTEMEFTPEISSALDIYADEVTAFGDEGRILNVVSKDAEIKKVLETLFFDILNIEFNAWSWVRNLVKYGDMVLFVDASEQNGILNLLPIPINEIEREEGYDKNDPFAVRFRWLTQGNQILENWQMIHFRLLGNDNFLPYGSSVVEPARRIWRQLILIEDAMLVYRIVRSPERRVFYIDVGNINPAEVDQFMEQVKTRLRRNQVIDPNTGRVDLRYNPLSVDEDYFIPTRGDKSSKIETLAGGQFTGDIEDVQYIQNKLFAALKVPKAHLGYEAELGSKATLAQMDVRFARTIERIQKIVIAELNKIALIHLYMLGYEGEDLVDFELRLANPSTIAEQQKLELWRMKFEIAGSATEGILDRDSIYRKIFNFSNEEIMKIKEGKKSDKLEDLILEGMKAPTDEAAEDAVGGEEEPLPGEEELPSTLGGETGGGEGETAQTAPEASPEPTTTPEGVIHEDVKGQLVPGAIVRLVQDPDRVGHIVDVPPKMHGNLKLLRVKYGPPDEQYSGVPYTSDMRVSEWVPEDQLEIAPMDEKRNPGSEGQSSEIAVDKGKDLFSTGEDSYNLAFGTEKQTASDPMDQRAMHRLITRPFSEEKDVMANYIDESIERNKELDKQFEEAIKGVFKRVNRNTFRKI